MSISSTIVSIMGAIVFNCAFNALLQGYNIILVNSDRIKKKLLILTVCTMAVTNATKGSHDLINLKGAQIQTRTIDD